MAAVQGGRAELALVRPSSCTSDFGLLRDFQTIIDLNAEVSHGRLELGVSWKQLGRPKVLGAQLDRRCLCPAHRVRAVLGGVLGGVLGAVLGSVKAELFNPVPEDPRVRSGAPIRRFVQPAGKQEVLELRAGLLDPRLQDVPRCLCDLELDRTLRLVLHDDGARRHLVAIWSS